MRPISGRDHWAHSAREGAVVVSPASQETGRGVTEVFHESLERRVAVRTLFSTDTVLRRRGLIAVGAASMLALAACSSGSGTETAEDIVAAGSGDDGKITLVNCGHEIVLDAPAERLITVNQGATESALAVGGADRMIGTAYLDDEISPRWAEAYGQIPVLAPQYPDRETVLEQRPDLIGASYASAFDDKELGSRASFDELGIATYLSPFACDDKADRSDPTWESIEGEIADYGLLLGRSAEADELIAAQREVLADLTAQSVGEGVSVLWWDGGTDAPFVGAGEGGPQLIMDAVGATNIFADVSGNWADVSWEDVLTADPDLIVLIESAPGSAEEKREYIESDPALKDLTAVREGAFVTIPFSASTPGPRTVEGAERLADHLADD